MFALRDRVSMRARGQDSVTHSCPLSDTESCDLAKPVRRIWKSSALPRRVSLHTHTPNTGMMITERMVSGGPMQRSSLTHSLQRS